ncbi:MAG: cyclase family protein [Candidatus Omnitrophica bacterium]|nr:cyclase family protein [Candidatus Omnitrophota bacterium]
MYKRLSYDISKRTPVYPGDVPVVIRSGKSIKRGDSCNTFSLAFSNHIGTHVDAPKHFWNSGRSINEFSPDELVFDRPCLIDCRKGPGEAIEAVDISRSIRSRDFDILLIRTGFMRHREKNARLYRYKNPYLSPDAAKWIRSEIPGLRAIGIDCISIGSFSDRAAGKLTHRTLLKESGPERSAILIVEDINIPREVKAVRKLIIAPVFIDGVDSAPCTIIGEVRERI